MRDSYRRRARRYHRARIAHRLHRHHGHHYGPGPGRSFREIRDFFAGNPECATALATHRAHRLIEEGFTPEEIRDELEFMREVGVAPDLDIDSILDT
jgi:hypothetical protein